MIIDFHNFHKQAKKRKPAQKKRPKQAIRLFEKNPRDPLLHNHPLTGTLKGHRSISFGGDWRAHYVMKDKYTAHVCSSWNT